MNKNLSNVIARGSDLEKILVFSCRTEQRDAKKESVAKKECPNCDGDHALGLDALHP